MHNRVREVLETEVQTSMEDYGDLIVQNLGSRTQIQAADLPDTLPIDAQLAEYDVMGEVDRYGADEAVLIGQKLRGLTVALQGSFSAEANIEFSYVFGFDADRLSFRLRDDRGDDYGAQTETGVINEVNNDILYHVAGKASAGYKDGAASAGGGPESFVSKDETHYLDEVGVLPEVSAREDLEEHMVITSAADADPDDGQLRVYSSWQLYWLETDDEIEARQIDMLE